MTGFRRLFAPYTPRRGHRSRFAVATMVISRFVGVESLRRGFKYFLDISPRDVIIESGTNFIKVRHANLD
jgi:hypothetical protein